MAGSKKCLYLGITLRHTDNIVLPFEHPSKTVGTALLVFNN